MNYFFIPYYFENAIKRLKEKNWLIHNFEITDDDDLYCPNSYLLDPNIKYHLKLDSNIYQYIINSYKKEKFSDDFKNSIALVIFCQISNISIEPQYAIYEKIKYSKDENLLGEVLDDLQLFRQIDNTHPDQLAKYMLGETSSYSIEEINPINREYLKQELTKYDRLKEWDSMYLIMLFITYSHTLRKLSNYEKLQYFLKLLITDFRLSLPAFIFALIFFGKQPIKKMMKFKETNSKEKHHAIINMTWDLYFINRVFRDHQNKEINTEYLYASSDKALTKITKTALAYQNTNDIKFLNDHWDAEKLNEIDQLYNDLLSKERIYLSPKWTHEYRNELIQQYEKLLGLNEVSHPIE